MIKGTWLEPLAWFVFAAIAVTGVFSGAYLIVQQNYRESLNDPQIQIAEDAVAILNAGGTPAEVVKDQRPLLVDISISLDPWIEVFDTNGTPVTGTGAIGDTAAQLPTGVFDTSTWLKHPNGLFYNQSPFIQTRFTWQPNPTVRQAVVLVQTKDKKYFVASGRNMREVEQRIEHEGEIVFVAWLFTLGCLFVASFIGWRLLKAR